MVSKLSDARGGSGAGGTWPGAGVPTDIVRWEPVGDRTRRISSSSEARPDDFLLCDMPGS